MEILPSQATYLPKGSVAERYVKAYLEEFERPLELLQEKTAWGAPEKMSVKWAKRRRRQACEVLPFLRGDDNRAASLLCDLSGGAGYYTLEYAKVFQLVLHCDLSVDSLTYVRQKALRFGLQNIFFLRVDYLHPPFRRSIDQLICLDTLCRGQEHEKVLLEKILESLAPGGSAVVDFHNWWHNPLRRTGIMRQNFADNSSYSRIEAERILQRSGVREFAYQPFCQEFDPLTPTGRILSRIVPATRFMYRIVA